MTNSTQISPLKTTKLLLRRYNLVIFIVIVACSLILAIVIITGILAQPPDTNSNTASNFDQATANRLERYEPSGNNTRYNNLPPGRINPFFE